MDTRQWRKWMHINNLSYTIYKMLSVILVKIKLEERLSSILSRKKSLKKYYVPISAK